MTTPTAGATPDVDTEGAASAAEDVEAQNLLADAVDADGEGDDQDTDPEGAEQLGDGGKRALAAMKEKWKAERAKRREAEAKLSDREAPADKTDPEKVARDAEAAATARANARILRSEIKAAAAGKLADPKDALRFLDLDSFEVDADGEVDEDEIAEAIADLVKRKPYLAAAAQGGRRRFEGEGDGGARKGAAKPITEEQLSKMSPAQIEQALSDGRLAHLL